MKVVELEGGESFGGEVAKVKAKRALVGVGARILFYQTLAHNLIRNKVQAEFHWWDEVDQFILLGAVPFPSDVPRLQQLGIRGVVTLNEPYETLVPSSLYQVHGIDHLVIPTGDYLFAPSLVDIHRAVDFIHRNASCGRITYVHCKAGRGRSATIVLCYLVEHKNMTPAAALEYVRSRRPRVLLAPSQWRVVQQYSRRKSEFPAICPRSTYSLTGDEVLINEADVEGYNVGEVTKDHSSSSCEIARAGPMIVKHTPKDEVLVTEADVEGYNVGEVIIDLSNSSCKIARASPLIVKHMPKDEVLITEADVEGYNVGEVSKDFDISSCKIAKASPLIVKHMPKSAVGGDEVLVTEADLEGYDTFLNSFENKSLSSVKTSRTRKVMRKLSRLCPSLKFSAAAQPVVSWVHEIHAC